MDSNTVLLRHGRGASLVVRAGAGLIDDDRCISVVRVAAVGHVASHRSADSLIPSAVDRMALHRSELDQDVLDLQDRLNDV